MRVRLGRAPRGLIVGAVAMYKQPRNCAAACTLRAHPTISLLSVVLEELTFRRYPRVLDLVRLALYGIIENFGYRQLTTWWRLVGSVDYFRGKQGWGVMTRKGFSQ